MVQKERESHIGGRKRSTYWREGIKEQIDKFGDWVRFEMTCVW